MAESIAVSVTGLTSNRLKDFKQPVKEPEEVKSTRKLLEGINLRRNQREKKFAKNRTLDGYKDIQSLNVDAGNVTENDNLNVKQKVPPSSHHGPFPVQPRSLHQEPPEGPSAVNQGSLHVQFPPSSQHGPFPSEPPPLLLQGPLLKPFAVEQGLFQSQSPLPLQGPLLGLSAVDQGLLQLQSPLPLRGLPQGLSAVDRGVFQLQSPLPLQGLPQGLSAVDQGLLSAVPTSVPPGPHQGLPPLMLQGPGLLHPVPVQHQELLGEESEESENTEQEQCLDDTDENERDVDDYASKEDKCLHQEMTQKAKLLHSEKECEVLEGIEYFKKYLEKNCDRRQSYIQDNITIIPQLVQLLSCSKDRKLHGSVLYVLMLIATGYWDCFEDIIEAGGVPVLIEFVTLENQEVAENALKVLAHIASEGTEARDCVLKHGMVPALMKFSEELNHLSKDFLELIICMIVQVFRPERCDAQKVLPLIGLLKEIVTVSTEKGVVHHVYSALYFMSESDGENPLIQAVVDSGICQILIHHIDGNEMSGERAMRTFANIALKSDAYVRFLLDLDILNVLKPLIKNYWFKSELMREVFRLLSKIMAGTQQQIQIVIDCELIGPLLDCLTKCFCGSVREECIWCVCNLLSRGNPDQRRYAVSQGCIAALCARINDRSIFASAAIIVTLEALQSLITDSCEPDAEYHMSLVEECGGLDEIEKCKDHHRHRIAELSCSIIEIFTRRGGQQNK